MSEDVKIKVREHIEFIGGFDNIHQINKLHYLKCIICHFVDLEKSGLLGKVKFFIDFRFIKNIKISRL